MKRTMSRKIRFNAEMNPIAPHDAEYIGKHENIIDSIAELFEEVCEDLAITAEFIAEITAPARKLAERVTARVRKSITKYIPMPEFKPVRNIWKGVVTYGTV